jgi:hypothetical protein
MELFKKAKDLYILFLLALALIAFILGEKSACNSLGGEYNWDYGTCNIK